MMEVFKMRNIWKYLIVGLVVLGLFALVGLPFLARGLGLYRGYGNGMMGNWGYYPMMGGFGMLGGLIMFLLMGLPVVLIVLAVAGVFGLLRRPETTVTPPAPSTPAASRTCPDCGKPAQADWTACPYCGQKL
jgi:uncharacterized membrane protein